MYDVWVGPFSRRYRKNSKFLTYSISKVEKDQTVTKNKQFLNCILVAAGPGGHGVGGALEVGGPRLSEGLTQQAQSAGPSKAQSKAVFLTEEHIGKSCSSSAGLV